MIWLACVIALAADGPQGFVDESASAPSSEAVAPAQPEGPLPPPQKVAAELPWYQNFKLTGFVDADAAFWLPGKNAEAFVGEAEVDVEKQIADVAAVRLDVNFRRAAPWDPSGNPLLLTVPVLVDQLVEQAYADYFPIGEEGPRFRVGKFNALTGFERQDAPDRLMASQSLVFLHGSPANFVGGAFIEPLPAGFHFQLLFSDVGWDRGPTDVRSKNLGGAFGFAHDLPKSIFIDANFTLLYGTSHFAGANDRRFAGFFSLALHAGEDFLLAGEATYAHDGGMGRAPDGSIPGTLSAEWWGVSLWARYRFLSWLSAVVRYDDFEDPSRVRGLEPIGFAPSIDAGETQRQQISADIVFVLAPGAMVRAEYSADFLQSRAASFLQPLTRTDRFLVQAVYGF